MISVSSYEFCKMIANDFGIEPYQKYKKKQSSFPIKNGKRKISCPHDAVIVDKNGKEHPYMISLHTRNEEQLKDFDYIYTVRAKTIDQIIKETGVKLKTERCRISEGNGSYSLGTKFFYKNTTCEE